MWTRDVDEVEMAYTSLRNRWRGTGRSFFHMTGHLSLEASAPADGTKRPSGALDAALRSAWVALRYHYPTIASEVKLNPSVKRYQKTYLVDSDGWLEQTFVIISSGQTGQEWANNDPPAPSLPTLYVVVPPSDDGLGLKRDLVLRAPHDVIDGIGTLLLFDNFIRLASEMLEKGEPYSVPSLDDPQVPKHLSPPYRVAAAVPAVPSETVTQRLEALAAANRAHASQNNEIALLPLKKQALVPNVHRRVEMVLSAEETSKLTVACQRFGCTVTHIFHAAIALVLCDLQPKAPQPRPVQYVGYLLRNERRSCISPYNDHRHAAAVYHSVSSDKLVVDMEVPSQVAEGGGTNDDAKRKEFTRIAQVMKNFYLKVRDDKLHYCLAPLLAGAGTEPLVTDPEAASIIPEVPPPSDSPTVTISSMGRIDDIIAHKHGDINVSDPWVVGEELRSSLGLFLGTFRGRLSLSAAYNDAWHDRAEVLDFLKQCLHIVNIGLDQTV